MRSVDDVHFSLREHAESVTRGHKEERHGHTTSLKRAHSPRPMAVISC